jgi:hypothetical protein
MFGDVFSAESSEMVVLACHLPRIVDSHARSDGAGARLSSGLGRHVDELRRATGGGHSGSPRARIEPYPGERRAASVFRGSYFSITPLPGRTRFNQAHDPVTKIVTTGRNQLLLRGQAGEKTPGISMVGVTGFNEPATPTSRT